MRKLVLIVSLLCTCYFTGVCQQFVAEMNIDSLKKVLVTAKDTHRINTLNFLAKRIIFLHPSRSDLDTAASITREALELSKKLAYGKGIGNAILNEIINNATTSSDVHTRLSMAQAALPLLREGRDWFSAAACMESIGHGYHYLGNNKQAVQFFDSAVVLFQQLGDTVTSVWTMIPLAHSYFDLGNFTAAYTTFHKAQELTPITDTMLQCFTSCQLAALFVGANLPDIAIEYMNKVREFFRVFSDQKKKELGWTLNWVSRVGAEAFLQLNQIDSAIAIEKFLNIPFEEQDPPDNLFYGQLYSAMGNHKKALVYYEHGYEASKKKSYEIGHACHANGLADAYFHLGNYPKAIYYANEAVKVSKKMPALLEEQRAIGTLGKIYAATKDFKKAFYYDQLYKRLNDSLAPEEYKRKISLIQVRDQLELQRNEARFLASQNQLNQQQIKLQESSLKRRSLLLYISIAALLLLVLLGIVINRNIKLKRRKVELQQLMEQVNAHQKMTELEREKTNLEMQALRAQMNPHFIFNCLSSINRFILTNKIEEASDYLTKFSRLIRMALNNSEKSVITLESELDALKLYLDLERLRFRNAFDYSITFINTIDINAVYIPPMLIQPFAENAIWHGLMHKDSGGGRLDIQLSAEEKTLTCTIADNGIGRSKAGTLKSSLGEKNKSMGVNITADRLSLLNQNQRNTATYIIEDLVDEEGDSRGTRVILAIPYKDLTELVA